MAGNVHVVPADGDGWAVEIEGGDGPLARFDTQEEAIAEGTERAQQYRVELLIHGRDGKIRARNSFGHDPRNIKG
ncbi:DUF2188 domain-containing protein [Cupriavidus respiraculi]|uniref:DUF2188 domain-containing protein n=1 Tax=Cupriavidus respiraculi TaxID=195930 RepID=A0ABM8WZJ5_9BURK|nr:DUF2188 domain-containing protein [Cupriavidus respiraculi]CAG9172988.1 hypothetical protein LMG21510_02128 [Cupriavidus respiraculi]